MDGANSDCLLTRLLTSKISTGTGIESVQVSPVPEPHLSLMLPIGSSRGPGPGTGSQSFSPYILGGTLTYGLVESQEAFVEVCDLVLERRVCPEGQPQTPP